MRERTRILGWGLILVFPVVLAAVVEGGLRLFDVVPVGSRGGAVPAWIDRNILAKEAPWRERLSTLPGDLKNYYRAYRWDRYLFYRLAPNLSLPMTDVFAPPGIRERTRWVLKTNALGFPGRAGAPGPHPGVVRILAMGDSSTFGWGVEAERAYPAVLERILAGDSPGRRVEVVNLGVFGYSSLQGRVLWEREGRAYEPEIVVISYGSNDWSHVPEPFDAALERNAGWSGALQSVLRRSRAYQVWAGFLLEVTAGGSDADGEAPPGDRDSWPLNVGPEKSRANLVALARSAAEAGAEPIFVTNCVPGDMSNPVRLAAGDAGAPLVDTEALLAAARDGAVPGLTAADRARSASIYGETALREFPDLAVYLADRCHPNPAGHRLLANAVADEVRRSRSFAGAAHAAAVDALPSSTYSRVVPTPSEGPN